MPLQHIIKYASAHAQEETQYPSQEHRDVKLLRRLLCGDRSRDCRFRLQRNCPTISNTSLYWNIYICSFGVVPDFLSSSLGEDLNFKISIWLANPSTSFHARARIRISVSCWMPADCADLTSKVFYVACSLCLRRLVSILFSFLSFVAAILFPPYCSALIFR